MENREKVKKQKICLALGFFDCVHIGHASIINKCVDISRAYGVSPAVFTFFDDPKKNGVTQLYSFERRKKLFAEFGVETIVAYPFSEKIKNTEPLDFLSGLLSDYDITAFVCGEDYTYGKNGSGNVKTLSAFCSENGIKLFVMPELCVEGVRVSSSEIKRLISAGEIERANLMLGREYEISGVVVRGRGEGHLFGIPTINLNTRPSQLLPENGVYATIAFIDGKEYKSVTNIGEKPTFEDFTPTIESLVGGGYYGNAYGKTVSLRIYYRIRDTKAFETPLALAEQVRRDLNEWEELC